MSERKTTTLGTLLSCAALLAACGDADVAATSTAVVYEGARVIVGDGTVIDDAAFVVDEGRIEAVAQRGALTVPEGTSHVDLGGMTVMPAIVDSHVHLSAGRESRIDDLERRAWFGVGTVINMGSDVDDQDLALRGESLPDAARFLSAGKGITRPEPGRNEVHWIDTPAEGRQAVRAELARGADLVKIWVDDRDGRYEKLTPELYSAIIDEAHSHGLRVAAHIFTLDDAKGLVHAGIDIFAHGVRDRDIDDEFVQLVTANPGIILIPNLPDRGIATDAGWAAGAVTDDVLVSLSEPESNPQVLEAFGIQARNLDRLHAAGMRIAMGTDGNRPWGAHVEMEDMVAAGVPAADVLVAATGGGAAVLGLEDVGTIAPGRRADFLVLQANPLDDITNTRSIVSVYLGGVEVDRVGLGAKWSAAQAIR